MRDNNGKFSQKKYSKKSPKKSGEYKKNSTYVTKCSSTMYSTELMATGTLKNTEDHMCSLIVDLSPDSVSLGAYSKIFKYYFVESAELMLKISEDGGHLVKYGVVNALNAELDITAELIGDTLERPLNIVIHRAKSDSFQAVPELFTNCKILIDFVNKELKAVVVGNFIIKFQAVFSKHQEPTSSDYIDGLGENFAKRKSEFNH